MYNVRIWDTRAEVKSITSRDYYDLHDAILSAAIDLGVKPDVDYPTWHRQDWEEAAPGAKLYYNGTTVAVIHDLSLSTPPALSE